MARRLPLEYAIRNLGRRPLRTILTGLACALVTAVLVGTVSFVKGLDQSFGNAGSPDVAILLSTAAQRDVVRSAISPSTAEEVAASVPGVRMVSGVPAVSPEIHMGTKLRLGDGSGPGDDVVHAAFVRGVTQRAFLVHDGVTIVDGHLPGPGQVLVGSLVANKLRVAPEALSPGRRIRFEEGTFTISGRFSAPGTTTESEIWAPLEELKGHAQRDDISVVFVGMEHADGVEDLQAFAQTRLDLELVCISSATYYRELSAYFAPIRNMVWVMAFLIGATVLFTGANTLNTAVQDRIRELATLRALGFPGPALAVSLFAEALLLVSAGGLLGLLAAHIAVSGSAFRIGMGAFSLAVDADAVLAGFAGVALLGTLGTLPAAVRVLRLRIASALVE